MPPRPLLYTLLLWLTDARSGTSRKVTWWDCSHGRGRPFVVEICLTHVLTACAVKSEICDTGAAANVRRHMHLCLHGCTGCQGAAANVEDTRRRTTCGCTVMCACRFVLLSDVTFH